MRCSLVKLALSPVLRLIYIRKCDYLWPGPTLKLQRTCIYNQIRNTRVNYCWKYFAAYEHFSMQMNNRTFIHIIREYEDVHKTQENYIINIISHRFYVIERLTSQVEAQALQT